MERRTFIKSATALASIPILPSSAFGNAPLSATLIARAEHMAGLWVHTSAQMMKNAFALDDRTAQALFATLRDKNVLSAPNTYGVARAVLPCYDNPVFAAKVNRLVAKSNVNTPSAANHHELKEMAEKLKQEAIKTLDTPQDTISQEEPK